MDLSSTTAPPHSSSAALASVTSQTFSAAWSPSKANALDASGLTIPRRMPRAWERLPKVPTSHESRFKKVWRRYELRSQNERVDLAATESGKQSSGGFKSPGRAVKKLRVKSPRHSSPTKSFSGRFVATKWDRRRSVLPRKMPHGATLEFSFAMPNTESLKTDEETPAPDLLEPLSNVFAFQEEDEMSSEDEDSDVESQPLSETLAEAESLQDIQRESEYLREALETDYIASQPQETEQIQLTPPSENVPSDNQRPHPDHVISETMEEPLDHCDLVETDHVLFNNTSQRPGHSPSKELAARPDEALSSDDEDWHDKAQAEEKQEEVREDVSGEDSTRQDRANNLEDSESPAPEEADSTSVHSAGEPDLSRSLNQENTADRVPEDASSPKPSSPAGASSVSPPETQPTLIDSVASQLDDDRAILKSFLDRAAASKANKAANISRRESIQNRRDSDVIRQALASPRQPLEMKDANLFSSQIATGSESLLDSPTTKTSTIEADVTTDSTKIAADAQLLPMARGSSPRRSTRTRRSRASLLPTTASAPPNKIPVRRTDGTEPVVLSKTEAQELANLTRRNTRKNKGGALSALDRLVQWNAEIAVNGQDGTTPEPRELDEADRGVRWSETLSFFNPTTGKSELADLIDNSAPAAAEPVPVKLPIPLPSVPQSSAETPKSRSTKSQTSRVRRLRGLGAANGTPAKGLLATTLLPDEIAEEAAAAKEAATAILTSVAETKGRKSKLATPRKLNLAPNVSSLLSAPIDGHENSTSRLPSPKKLIGSATGGKKRISLLPIPGDLAGGVGSTASRKRGGKKVVV